MTGYTIAHCAGIVIGAIATWIGFRLARRRRAPGRSLPMPHAADVETVCTAADAYVRNLPMDRELDMHAFDVSSALRSVKHWCEQAARQDGAK